MSRDFKKGFTLIEMVVAIVLVGFLSTLIGTLISRGNSTYRLGLKRIDYNESADKVVSDFEKITRGATAILAANNSNLTFLSYLKGDQNPAPSKISYYITENTLFRSVILPTSDENGGFDYLESEKQIVKLGDGLVGQEIFKYYDESMRELTLPLQVDVIRMIRMSIGIDFDINSPPETAYQQTVVQLRNLKTNF